jgi:tRNA A37 threonylcarbamoyladenosine dehydratase
MNENIDRFSRCKMLFGNKFEDISNLKIIILGVGGVGGHALDCLYRSGVQDITIVDFDTFDITNQNRQIGSNHINKIKVDTLKNIYPGIKTKNEKITKEWVYTNDLSEYDFIFDAIDDIYPKVELIKKYYKTIITTSGSAKRIDPTKIEYISIWKTFNDPFIRKIRNLLKKDGFNKKLNIVFSGENPVSTQKGSYIGVTASFGLAMCSYCINKTLSKV